MKSHFYEHYCRQNQRSNHADVSVVFGRCSENWSKDKNATWTDRQHQAVVERVKTATSSLRCLKELTKIQGDDDSSWALRLAKWMLQWVITGEVRCNERKQAAPRPVWWEETGWNWLVAEPPPVGCFYLSGEALASKTADLAVSW